MLPVPHRSQPDAADQTDRQLGASVRARRIERGLSQTALARAVGVSQAAISGVMVAAAEATALEISAQPRALIS